MDEKLSEFGRRWATAELKGDVETLDALLTEDFRAVGPRGFVLCKAQWLARYASDLLIHDVFTWEEVEVRRYGNAAVAIGVQSQQSIYDLREMDGRFRMTQFLTEHAGEWRLAGAHLTPAPLHAG